MSGPRATDPAATTHAGQPINHFTSTDNTRQIPNGSAVADGLEASPVPSITRTLPSPPPVLTAERDRNHAPGIPDRRKSVRPSGSRGNLRARRSRQALGHIAIMEDDGVEAKGGEEVVTPGDTAVSRVCFGGYVRRTDGSC
jgi:hypothetical protein